MQNQVLWRKIFHQCPAVRMLKIMTKMMPAGREGT